MKVASRSLMTMLASAVLAACVTINVYFPAAAAERAADEFIRDVLGPAVSESTGFLSPQEAAADPVSGLAWLDLLIPAAHAQQANIDINTPRINAIKSRMTARQQNELGAFFDAGAIGFNNAGEIEIRDASAVSLQQRRKLERLVAEENRDRAAVYKEIAAANGHPEWEDDIRQTFARRWVSNAKAGWYYRSAGNDWVKK